MTPRPDRFHVLLIDDNEDTRLILATYLEHLGATVTTARNAGDLELLDKLFADDYTLIQRVRSGHS